MSERTLDIDIETYSSVDLKKAGVYAYAESPDFEVLMAAWSDDGETYHLALGEAEVRAIPGLFDTDTLKVAHNAQFERVCLSVLAGLPRGEYLPPEQWDDTAALAAEHGYPRDLNRLAKALGAEEKDSAGTRLINLFCRPQRGRRVRPGEKPEQWEQFKAYCVQDVRTLTGVRRLLPSWPPLERRAYLTDQRVNDRGIAVDLPMTYAAIRAAESNRADQLAELREITELANPNSGPQLLGWLEAQGAPLPNLQKATVAGALEGPLPDDVRRVLVLRQGLALVASKKFTAAALGCSTDGRLRGAFKFYGAHTGRWSGRGVQLQNLPRSAFMTAEGEYDLSAELAARDALSAGHGADAETLKKLIRPLFVGPFSVSDYSAIEARVIAWLSGEQWVLDAFEAGRDIYVETGKRMGGLSRQQGKVAVLALGYAGGVGSLRVMGAEGSDAELQRLVDKWRAANPRTVRLWAALQNGFGSPRSVGRHLRTERHGGDVHLVLPSGRALVYHEVKWERYRLATDDGPVWKEGFRFVDPVRGTRVGTYGGRLTENVTQAVARDLLAAALVRLDAAGLPVVGHVHDEAIVEGDRAEQVSELMCASPSWAAGLPVSAEGFVTTRYRKG